MSHPRVFPHPDPEMFYLDFRDGYRIPVGQEEVVDLAREFLAVLPPLLIARIAREALAMPAVETAERAEFERLLLEEEEEAEAAPLTGMA